MAQLRALVFDMDGLMIDSERLYIAAEREMARSFGKEVRAETLGRMMGRKPVESLEIYVREAGLPISAEEAFEIRTAIMRRKLRDDLAAMPGLDRILERFRGRLKLAVATGAQGEFLRIVIAQLRLDGVFDVLQDSDDIAAGKPDPAIFLAACGRLEIPPSACAVLEDSENGVAAGRRAGCYVIAVPNEYTRSHDFTPADFVASGLDEAAVHIESRLAAVADENEPDAAPPDGKGPIGILRPTRLPRVGGKGRSTMNTRVLAAFIPLCFAAACARGPAAEELRASGTIEARQVRLSAKTSGDLLEVLVREGDRVKPGDRIAAIDHAGLDIQLRQAEAGTVLAQAQFDLLKAGARVEDIRQAEEAVRQAETASKAAEEDARRMRALAAKGSITAKQAEDAESRLIVARAQTAGAAEALKKVRTLARPEELRAARARFEQAQAAADMLRKTIADCALVSPVAGIVTQVLVEAGELVAAGATVAVVSDLDRVHVMIYVTEAELARVKLGGKVDVVIDGAPGRTFVGTITYISPEAEFTPKNIQTREDRVKLVFGVKIEIDNRDGLLKPGLPADAVLTGLSR